jgi:TPR repeat protein
MSSCGAGAAPAGSPGPAAAYAQPSDLVAVLSPVLHAAPASAPAPGLSSHAPGPSSALAFVPAPAPTPAPAPELAPSPPALPPAPAPAPAEPPPPSFSSFNPTFALKTCAYCGAVLSGRWLRCTDCKTSFFCSLDHQWRNWPAHREACTRIRLARDAVALAPYAGVDEVEAAVRAWFAAQRAEADAEAAAEDALERARIGGLDERALRRELLRREISPPADAPREALLAARLAAPDPTPEQNLNFVRREVAAHEWSRCRYCERALPDPLGTTGRCSGCKKLRYCGAECQRVNWPHHRAECGAWKAEADAAAVAAGGCPLGDLAAQQEALDKAEAKPLAALRAAAEGGDLAALCVLGSIFREGSGGLPVDDVQAVSCWQRAAAGNVAAAQTSLGSMYGRGGGGLAVDFVAGFRLSMLAARQGHAEAQFNCGCCFHNEEGVARDLFAAVSFWRRAAEQGFADAQGALAQVLMFGEGVARDYAEALKLARQAAKQRDRVGEYVLGELYRHGWGVAKSAREAVTNYARALGQGSEAAKRALCELATEGVTDATAALHRAGVDAPLRAADAAVVAAGRCPLGDLAAQEAACKAWIARPLAAIRLAAEGGDLAAMVVLGGCFRSGERGAPQDGAQAVVWRRRSAAGNVATAQYNLGVMHEDGLGGLAQNIAEAARLYRLAADAGYAHAQFNLGLLYADGHGVREDEAEAVRLWKLAAAQGLAMAQGDLANAYRMGKGVDVDFAAALLFARRGAEGGSAKGAFHAGGIYHLGQGVPVDKREAVKWFAKGAAKGHENCIKGLRVLAAEGVAEAATALRRLRLAPW